MKVKPDYRAVHLPLAFSLARLGRYPESIEIYQQTLKYDPSNPEAYNNLSVAYNHTERYKDAVECSNQAIRLLGDTGEAYTQGFQERNELLSYAYKNLGNAYIGLKRYSEAADVLKRAVAIEPKNAAAHFNLGLTLHSAGRYAEAVAAYKEVVKLRPTLAQAHFNLGLTYIAMKDRDAAMAEYETLKGMNADMAKQLKGVIK